MITTTTINEDWFYTPEYSDHFTEPAFRPDDSWQRVRLPHSNIELPYNCFDERDFQFVSTYMKVLSVPPITEGDRVFIDFDGLMTAADLWVNGRPAGSHRGGYTPFSVDITDAAKIGVDNEISGKRRSSRSGSIPGNARTYPPSATSSTT